MNKSWIWREHKHETINVIVAIMVFILMTTLIFQGLNRGVFRYQVGDIASEDIVLPDHVVDEVATKELQDSVMVSIPDITVIDVNMQISVRTLVNDFFDALLNTKEIYKVEADMLQRIFVQLEKDNGLALNSEELAKLVMLPSESIERMQRTVTDVVSEYMSQGITKDLLSLQRENVKKYVSTLEGFSDQERLLMQRILEGAIKANATIDVEATETAKLEASNKVERIVVNKGTVLVERGNPVTERDIRLMTQSGVDINTSIDRMRLWMLATSFSLLIVIGVYYLSSMCQEVSYHDEYHGAIMGILILLLGAFSYFAAPLSIFLVPIGFFIMMTTIIFSSKMTIFVMGPAMLLMGVTAAFSTVDYVLVGSLYMIIALLSVGVDNRSKIYRIGVLNIGLYFMVFLGNIFINRLVFPTNFEAYLYPAIGGLLSSALTVGLLPVFEHVFKVVTPMQLLELGNPNHPLMKRLLFEAPGTYHHSILVSNLADAAATSIGADALLVRTASFYHDAGKLDRPYYFQENILSSENPHERLTHAMSASIIKEHPLRSEAILMEHKFPEKLGKLVREHHGTTLIRYFYHQAMESGEDFSVSDYTYDGPAPSSKESAILMLADSCEAAVRSLDLHSSAEISKMINRVVKQKLDEGQFLNTSLTFKDIEMIKGAFMKVFEGIYHSRISYPEEK